MTHPTHKASSSADKLYVISLPQQLFFIFFIGAYISFTAAGKFNTLGEKI